MKIVLDFTTYFTIGQVGSSVHKDLLKPNDIDIAIGFKLPFCTFETARTFRIGKFNFVVVHGKTVRELVNQFDFDILRCYKTLITRKLISDVNLNEIFRTKHIEQLERDGTLFNYYDEQLPREVTRYLKYKKKLPKGWTLRPLETVREHI